MRQVDYTRPEALAEAAGAWSMPVGGEALFHWDYDRQDAQMLRLYNQGKQRQWDADDRLDWDHEADPGNPLGMPDEFVSIAGSPLWDRIPESERAVIRRHTAGWLYSQFLHSEQFALLGVGKIAAATPSLEAKMYAATQVMDEARHADAFNRYIKTKIGVRYPLSPTLSALFEQVLAEPRWDLGVLCAHVLVENMGLAAFSMHKERMADPLAKAFMGYVLRDEARHVAFGRTLLRREYPHLSSKEIAEREEFALEGCWALRDRYVDDDMWHRLGYGEEAVKLSRTSPSKREFRRQVFMRIVPALKDIGLFGPRVKEGLAKMGVLGFADIDRIAGARYDEAEAEATAQAELNARAEEVIGIARLGAAGTDEADDVPPRSPVGRA
ncbi:ferritin-like domain-containing protein [Streptomyces sp. NPDC046876]|uniref:ferritin-like domain-containing protein n=1 Tax=Streptomyces sp. NPDC046876 TaxID=3155616 RepID=UPI0033E423E7